MGMAAAPARANIAAVRGRINNGMSIDMVDVGRNKEHCIIRRSVVIAEPHLALLLIAISDSFHNSISSQLFDSPWEKRSCVQTNQAKGEHLLNAVCAPSHTPRPLGKRASRGLPVLEDGAEATA